MLNRALEHPARPRKAVTGIKQAIDLGAVLGPLLYLVEIADVCVGDVFVCSSIESGMARA
jgi:hypothetical protein